MATVITYEQFQKALRRIDRSASAAGKADAKDILKSDFDGALEYDPKHMVESMALDEVVRSTAGERLSDRIVNLHVAIDDRRVEFAPGVGEGYRDGAIGELEDQALRAYVAAWDITVRAAAKARGVKPSYLRND